MPMDGRIASIALVVAAAWGSIAENSWCLRHAQSVLDAETDDSDMRAKKRLRTMTADLDRITDRINTSFCYTDYAAVSMRSQLG